MCKRRCEWRLGVGKGALLLGDRRTLSHPRRDDATMPTEEVFLHWSTSWSSSTSSSWSSCSSSSSSSSWCRGSASGGDGVGDVPRLASRLAPAGRWNRRPAVSFSLSVSHSTRFVCTREPARRFIVVRSTATTWLCRLSPTPSAASAPSPSSLSSSLFFPPPCQYIRRRCV